jgi:hypothetical protein
VIISTVAKPSEIITGNNTLRRHLYIIGLRNNPTCRKCSTEEETSVHILRERDALASLRCTRLGSFFLEPEDIRKLIIGAIWNFAKEEGSSNLVQNVGNIGPVLRPRCIGPGMARTQISFNSIQFNSIFKLIMALQQGSI